MFWGEEHCGVAQGWISVGCLVVIVFVLNFLVIYLLFWNIFLITSGLLPFGHPQYWSKVLVVLDFLVYLPVQLLQLLHFLLMSGIGEVCCKGEILRSLNLFLLLFL